MGIDLPVDPLHPIKGAEKFVKENVDVAKQYVRDYLTRAGKEALRDVPPGGGKVAEIEGRGLPRRAGRLEHRLAGMHAPRLRRPLERHGTEPGLSMPRQPIRP